MAHLTQQRFAQAAVEGALGRLRVERVLEVGSADINGSARSLFAAASLSSYCGVDLAEGPGVDKVGSAHLLDFPSGYFDAVLSFECFEHNPFWKETFANMVRMCRPGGVVIVSCAAPGRMEHGTTRSTPSNSLSSGMGWDYYKNVSRRDLMKSINAKDSFAYQFLRFDRRPGDLDFFGLKAGAALDQDVSYFSDWFKHHNEFFRWDEAQRPTAVLNLLFSYLEELGVSRAPWLRYRVGQYLKTLKRTLVR